MTVTKRALVCPECKRKLASERLVAGQRLNCPCGFSMEVPDEWGFPPEPTHCEACGASRDGAAAGAACAYCGAVPAPRSASMRLSCPFCSCRTAEGSRYCGSCGKALEPAALGGKIGRLRCPRCPRTRLVNRQEAELMVECCPACGGMWMGAEVFDRLMAVEVRKPAAPGELRDGSQALGPVAYLKCPVCRKPMNRRNFGRPGAVVVDECRRDGLWLDRGELERIAALLREAPAGAAIDHHLPLPLSTRGERALPVGPVGLPPLERVLAALRALLGSG